MQVIFNSSVLISNHILLGISYSNVPLSQPYPSPATISKHGKFAQQLADYLWNPLQKELYPSLITRQKWTAWVSLFEHFKRFRDLNRSHDNFLLPETFLQTFSGTNVITFTRLDSIAVKPSQTNC